MEGEEPPLINLNVSSFFLGECQCFKLQVVKTITKVSWHVSNTNIPVADADDCDFNIHSPFSFFWIFHPSGVLG